MNLFSEKHLLLIAKNINNLPANIVISFSVFLGIWILGLVVFRKKLKLFSTKELYPSPHENHEEQTEAERPKIIEKSSYIPHETHYSAGKTLETPFEKPLEKPIEKTIETKIATQKEPIKKEKDMPERVKKIIEKNNLQIFKKLKVGNIEMPISCADENTFFIMSFVPESVEKMMIGETEADTPSPVWMNENKEQIDSPLAQNLELKNRIKGACASAFNGEENIPFEIRSLIVFSDTNNGKLQQLKKKYEDKGIELLSINDSDFPHIKTVFENEEFEKPSGSFVEFITTILNNFDGSFKVIKKEKDEDDE
ncbi:MAG: hypothetical protein ACTSUM_02195 [Alphaproteobacteria bacterium]